jgi:hypothetical protein
MISLISKKEMEHFLHAIRLGANPFVAAQSILRIAQGTHGGWMARGDPARPGGGEEPYTYYRAAVLRAAAVARSGAESAVYADDPLAWLRVGPGGRAVSEVGPDGVTYTVPGWRVEDVTTTNINETKRVEIVFSVSGPQTKELPHAATPGQIIEGDLVEHRDGGESRPPAETGDRDRVLKSSRLSIEDADSSVTNSQVIDE